MTSDSQADTDAVTSTGPEPESYAFVMNVRRLTDATSHTLAPGHELRRAGTQEIARIKQTVTELGPEPNVRYSYLWEQPWPHPGGVIHRLAPEDWRYYVIAFRGTNTTIDDLICAFDLASVELEVGFTVVRMNAFGTVGSGLVIHNQARLFHALELGVDTESFFLDVSPADIEMVRAIHTRLRQPDERLADLKRLVNQLGQLKALPRWSPLRFLGYFGVLESLLTHAPTPHDPYDSITRQVKKKLALLDHRWPAPLDYSPFRGANPDAVWSKMYAYRSAVAHGGAPEFTGELAILKDHGTALRLVRDTVKAVIRQALAEPELVLDLREC